MPMTPPTPSLMREINDLKKRLRRLETRRSLGNSSISEGDLSVTSGGAFRVVDAGDGHEVGRIGALPSWANRSDGSPQPGVLFNREDGTLAGFLGDLNATTPPYRQAWQILDRAGHVVFADDTNSGQGIALPYLTFGMPVGNGVPTDTTTSGTFTTLQAVAGYWMSPKLLGQILIYASDGATAGQVRIVDENGAQLGATITVAAGAFQWVTWGPVTPPGSFGDPKTLNFQARRTAGTGTIGLRASTVIGVQS